MLACVASCQQSSPMWNLMRVNRAISPGFFNISIVHHPFRPVWVHNKIKPAGLILSTMTLRVFHVRRPSWYEARERERESLPNQSSYIPSNYWRCLWYYIFRSDFVSNTCTCTRERTSKAHDSRWVIRMALRIRTWRRFIMTTRQGMRQGDWTFIPSWHVSVWLDKWCRTSLSLSQSVIKMP